MSGKYHSLFLADVLARGRATGCATEEVPMSHQAETGQDDYRGIEAGIVSSGLLTSSFMPMLSFVLIILHKPAVHDDRLLLSAMSELELSDIGVCRGQLLDSKHRDDILEW
jgi:hypothetical protein